MAASSRSMSVFSGRHLETILRRNAVKNGQTMCFVCGCTRLCQLTTNWNYTCFCATILKDTWLEARKAIQAKMETLLPIPGLKGLGLGSGVTKERYFLMLNCLFMKNHKIIALHYLVVIILCFSDALVYHCSTITFKSEEWSSQES